MQGKLAAGLIAALALAASPARANVVSVQAGVSADGSYQPIPLVEVSPGVYAVGTMGGNGVVSPFVWDAPGEFHMELSGTMDADPHILTSVTVTDFGAPTTFVLSWSTPVAATGPTSVVRSSISAAFTEGTSGTPFDFTPANGLAPGRALSTSLSDGSTTVSPVPGLSIGASFSAGPMPVGTQYSGYSDAAGPIAGPAGNWTQLGLTLGFSLDGGDDTASVNVFSEALPTPLPGGLALLASGLLVLASVARRRGVPAPQP